MGVNEFTPSHSLRGHVFSTLREYTADLTYLEETREPANRRYSMQPESVQHP